MRLGRRKFIAGLGSAMASAVIETSPQTERKRAYRAFDVAVIGAGSFGAWTALELVRRGRRVVLLDAYGPANSRASSGGESRIIRMGYGPDEIYTRWAVRSLMRWQEFFASIRRPLFHETGVLWLAGKKDDYELACESAFQKLGIRHRRLSPSELAARYPQIDLTGIAWGLLEPESGVLLARRATQAVVEQAGREGVEYQQAEIEAPPGRGALDAVTARDGRTFEAHTFVFACGPWLPKVFPALLGDRIFPTRQEVFFFGTPAGSSRYRLPDLPTWIDLSRETYGMPDLEGRGLKVAIDRHGPAFDPDTGNRVVTEQGLHDARAYLASRFPALADAPVAETRVCQYENTSDGNFLIDRHPDFENVWLVGGGSGHGFKHGPAVGEYVAERILKGGAAEPRFALASKQKVQHRAVF